MEPISLGIGLALSAAGGLTSFFGQSKKAEADQAATAAQQRAENLREQSMTIDADRKRREFIRQGQIARAQALTVATSQGAAQSSGLQGAYGQIGGQTDWNILGVNEQEEIGHGMFQANRDLLQARSQGAEADSQIALGKGISSLGGALVSNMGAIGRIYDTGMNSVGPAIFDAMRGQPGSTSLLGNMR